METRTAKLFKNGASQAVRLPAEFRFEGKEVYATRNSETGDVVLSSHPGSSAWRDFFALVQSTDSSDGFMSKRPMNRKPDKRNIFGNIE